MRFNGALLMELYFDAVQSLHAWPDASYPILLTQPYILQGHQLEVSSALCYF